MRIDRAEVLGFGGSSLLAAGIYGVAGWAWSAIFVGVLFVALAVGATMARKA